jgi:hypothetical protein
MSQLALTCLFSFGSLLGSLTIVISVHRKERDIVNWASGIEVTIMLNFMQQYSGTIGSSRKTDAGDCSSVNAGLEPRLSRG